MVKQLVAGDADVLAVPAIMGRVLACQQHAARAPRELVAEGIGVGLRRGQPAAPGDELRDPAAAGLHPVDDAHRGHVVDARVDADLVEQDDTRLARRRVELRHRLFDVRGGDHVDAMLETQGSHHGVIRIRQQADRQVGLFDQRLERRRIVGIDLHRAPARVALDQRLGLADRAAGDGDLEVRLAKQILDMRAGHHAGAEDDDSFHEGRLL